MANQHTAELERRAMELAQAIYPLETRAAELRSIIVNPQCGKPGKGYKAARKARKVYDALAADLYAKYQGVNTFIFSNKAGPDTRDRRRSAFDNALKTLKHSPNR